MGPARRTRVTARTIARIAARTKDRRARGSVTRIGSSRRGGSGRSGQSTSGRATSERRRGPGRGSRPRRGTSMGSGRRTKKGRDGTNGNNRAASDPGSGIDGPRPTSITCDPRGIISLTATGYRTKKVVAARRGLRGRLGSNDVARRRCGRCCPCSNVRNSCCDIFMRASLGGTDAVSKRQLSSRSTVTRCVTDVLLLRASPMFCVDCSKICAANNASCCRFQYREWVGAGEDEVGGSMDRGLVSFFFCTWVGRRETRRARAGTFCNEVCNCTRAN